MIGLIAFGSDASAQLNCQITVTPLAFGAYMPGDTVSLDSTGRLDMSCRGQGCLIQISMSPGHRAAS